MIHQEAATKFHGNRVILKNGSELRVKTGCFVVTNPNGDRVSDHRYCRGKFGFF